IIPHVGDEIVEALELLLLADEGVKRDLDLPVVEIAVESEQMRLEQLLRRLEGRPNAEARDPRMLRPVVERHAHSVDPVPWPLIIGELDVRGRVAELAAAPVAALDHPLDRIIA